jgi:hypothetical protein
MRAQGKKQRFQERAVEQQRRRRKMIVMGVMLIAAAAYGLASFKASERALLCVHCPALRTEASAT